MKILTGTSGYGYKEWKGNFYPEKLSAGKMLAFYAGRFPAVEINNTFYRMPTRTVVESWAEQVPARFTFVIKAPQIITHIKRLKDVKEETRYFLKTISTLGTKLGAALFQFPGSFRVNLSLLEEFLGFIPPKTPCAFLFRNKSWLSDGTYRLLSKNKCCLGFEDSDDNVATDIVTTVPWGYLRLRKTDYTDSELLEWSNRILAQKWKKAFVFFKHEDDAAARGPQLATSFDELVTSSQALTRPAGREHS